MSPLTKRRISESLKGKIVNDITRLKMSESRSGSKNYYFGKKLHLSTVLASQMARGKRVYVYYERDRSLVNNAPFISMRETAKYLPINPGTLSKKLDSGKPFKGYLYYSAPLE
jgi:group I intron endonuclease